MKGYLLVQTVPTKESMKYQPMVLTTPDNVTKPYALNKQLH
ncbi:hypothetical protein [Candidatus Enterovibrio altilux]|uniref:Uncharacterized protein n=1 Tax=Candidatus Enterovibrio altilux TaxID=1927128 RepID=A0A291BA91_9GAMM|nr:hypothetical protein [Candidatus Enterovibrio luxaltus]ATF09920.1 hypothetical protein BTN50_1444 [Candidatus Enterovibrio luxaltus]